MQDFWADAEVIHRYTRAQALADGVLVEVPADLAREAGLRWPVALTAAAWADAVAWTAASEDAKPGATGQDETGRLWDVLTMTRLAARQGGQGRRAVQVLRVPAAGRTLRPRLTTLHLVAGPRRRRRAGPDSDDAGGGLTSPPAAPRAGPARCRARRPTRRAAPHMAASARRRAAATRHRLSVAVSTVNPTNPRKDLS